MALFCRQGHIKNIPTFSLGYFLYETIYEKN